MSDWKAVVDQKSGKTYYYNKKTKITTWDMPEEMRELQGDAGMNSTLMKSSTGLGASKTGKVLKEIDADGNVKKIIPKGVIFDPKTKTKARKLLEEGDIEAMNVPPLPNDDVKDNVLPSQTDEFDLGDPKMWKMALDHRNGKLYFYNPGTSQTTFQRPNGYEESESDIALQRGIMMSAAKSLQSENNPEADEKTNKMPVTKNERKLVVIRQETKKRLEDEMKEHEEEEEEEDEEKSGDEEKHSDEEEEVVELGATGIKFQFARHRKGLINRIFHLGKANDDQTMLTYKRTIIKKALLKENRKNDAIAIQCFKNIMSYMGDRRTMKADVGHAKKLIKNALTLCNQSLRDEIFLQIIKQVTGHPKVAHAIKGWELLMLVIGSFPPSTALRQFLEHHCEKVARTTSDENIRKFGKICLERIPRSMEMGARIEVPSTNEIKRDQSGNPLSLKIYTIDGAFRSMDVDCFTPVKAVKLFMCQRAGVINSSIFSLYEVDRNSEERVLEDKLRILDVIGQWDRLIKENKITHPEPFRLLFKIELVVKSTDRVVLEDEELLKLLYTQAVNDIVNERYPADPKVMPSMAALLLQVSFGDYNASTHTNTWLEEKVPEIFPRSVLQYYSRKKEESIKEAAQKVLSKYSKLKGVTPAEARLSFMDYAQEWALYGAYMVLAEQDFSKDYPNLIKLAVTCEGVFVVAPNNKDVLETWSWSEIITWGASSNRFVLHVGDIISQRKLYFRTIKGDSVMRLIQGYIMHQMGSKNA